MVQEIVLTFSPNRKLNLQLEHRFIDTLSGFLNNNHENVHNVVKQTIQSTQTGEFYKITNANTFKHTSSIFDLIC